MARSGDLRNGEVSPKRPGPVENSVKSDRAEKKPRLSRASSRKRARSEVEDTDTGVEESEDPSTSRKAIRVEGERHSGARESKEWELSNRPVSVRKWKRISKREEGSSAKEETGKLKQISEHEVVRKVLQTVHLSENCRDEETVEEDIVSREKKRRGSHDIQQPEKKPRIERVGTGAGTWRRLKGQKPNPTASEDMGVSVSEAWKRLREEKDSGSSVNGRTDSDLSMNSSDSELEERAKKARHDLPPPPQGRRWTRKSRERKESSSSKRLRDGGCESSSGSDNAHSSYYHNRKWKRPRFEYMMSMPWRRQTHDAGRENGRKRVQDDASVKPTKRQRR